MKKKEDRLTIAWWWFRDNFCRYTDTMPGSTALMCNVCAVDRRCRQRGCPEWRALREENKEYGKK